MLKPFNPKGGTVEEIKYRHEEFLQYTDVQKSIEALKERNKNIQLLLEHASQLGFTPAVGAKDFLGVRYIVEAVSLIKNPDSNETVSTVTFDFQVQNLENPKSKSILALGITTISAGKNVESYEMLLEGVDGNINDYKEWIVRNDKVVKARSWWHKMKTCLMFHCAGTCISALITCTSD